MAKIQTKTKTAVGIALAVATIGTLGFAAGLYYYSYRGGSSSCICPTCATCSKCQTCPKCDTAGKDTPPSTPPATPPSSGNVDLVLSRGGLGLGTSFEAGWKLPEKVTIQNQGTDPSGPFAVVGNYCGNKVTQQVSNLNGGESQSFILEASIGTAGSIHRYCRFSITVDANKQVKETNESNNSWVFESLRAR